MQTKKHKFINGIEKKHYLMEYYMHDYKKLSQDD